MTTTVLLREIAHCRSGDKGTVTCLSVMARRPDDYPLLVDQLSSDAVRAALGDRVLSGRVVRHEIPALATMIFVCHRAPEDSVTISVHQDAHGKTLSGRLLGLELERMGASER